MPTEYDYRKSSRIAYVREAILAWILDLPIQIDITRLFVSYSQLDPFTGLTLTTND